jgi:hypothetical protein
MGYEIEMSYDVKKQVIVNSISMNHSTKLLDNIITLGKTKGCSAYFHFRERDICTFRPRTKSKRDANIIIICFENARFTEMTNFLQDIIEKYKKKIHIESVYEIQHNNLIYASPYYMELMERDQKDQKEDYKHRRQTRSFSETDYFILRDILKKII